MGKISGKFHMKRKPISNFIKFSMLLSSPSAPCPLFFLSQKLDGRGQALKNTFIYPAIRGRTK